MKYASAILSGLLLTVIFPTVINGVHLPDLSVLVWVALVPLIFVCRRQSWRLVAGLSFVTGLVYNALVSYWIFYAMYVYGGLSSPASLAGVLVMASILGVMLSVVFVFVYFLDKRRIVPLIIALPIFWTLYEWVRNYGPFGGYPWSELAYSQVSRLSLIQSADLFGVYGLIFLIVFVNTMLVDLIDFILKRRKFPVFPILLSIVLMGVNYGYGNWRLKDVVQEIQKSETIKIALVQPNIPQELKWDPMQIEQSLHVLSDLTHQAIAQGADLVIWPESAYQDTIPSNLEELYEFAEWPVTILTGVVTALPPRSAKEMRRPLLQNSAVQFDPEGLVLGMYHKTHLVPMGEYVPLKNVLGFLEKVVPAIGDFVPGRRFNLLPFRDKFYGVTVCYEDLFPEISRGFVLQGAHFLTNITNDAWYNDSSAQWQHLTFSQFRAVENRRPMLRSANTGVTAIIDSTGRVIKKLTPFTKDILVNEIPVGGSVSLYTKYGDFLWLSIFALVLAIWMVIYNIRRHVPPRTQG